MRREGDGVTVRYGKNEEAGRKDVMRRRQTFRRG